MTSHRPRPPRRQYLTRRRICSRPRCARRPPSHPARPRLARRPARAPARGAVSTRPKIQLTAREAFSRPQRARTTANAFFNGSGDDSNADGATQRVSTDSVMIDPVVGAKRFDYFGPPPPSTGFLITGLSAYFHHNLLFFLDASDIKFFPQGLVMSFYGVAGAMLATYLWLTISWDAGRGIQRV